ncbi:MAG: hypothetical protein H7144_17100 [Burkholderiales bacterium]|nr:hypothetical protein [Phycisphaerae bacterium]
MEDAPPVLIHIRDLIFSSKVVATARAINVPFKVVRDASKVLETPGKRLIVDLNVDGTLQTAIDWKQRHGGEVIGFVSHVATDTIQTAREAGIDHVMSNGAFSGQLETILSR